MLREIIGKIIFNFSKKRKVEIDVSFAHNFRD